MLITKEFIDALVDSENMQKYANGKSKLTLPTRVIEFAYTLVGVDHGAALKKLSAKMKREEEISLDNRNKFTPLFRALSSEVDYGFKVGDRVAYWYTQHTKRVGAVLSVDDGQVEFKDCIIPFSQVEKAEQVEQITLDI